MTPKERDKKFSVDVDTPEHQRANAKLNALLDAEHRLPKDVITFIYKMERWRSETWSDKDIAKIDKLWERHCR